MMEFEDREQRGLQLDSPKGGSPVQNVDFITVKVFLNFSEDADKKKLREAFPPDVEREEGDTVKVSSD